MLSAYALACKSKTRIKKMVMGKHSSLFFLSVSNTRKKAGVFFHGKLFNSSLIFVRNSKSLPIEYGVHLQILVLPKKLDRDKLTNLFCLGICGEGNEDNF